MLRVSYRPHTNRLLFWELLKHPLVPLELDVDRPLLVQALPPGVQDRRRQHRVGDRRQAVLVVVLGLVRPCVHAARSIDEFFDRDVAVPALSVKVAALGWRVFHAVQGKKREGGKR
jgi:hypothetical protein